MDLSCRVFMSGIDSVGGMVYIRHVPEPEQKHIV